MTKETKLTLLICSVITRLCAVAFAASVDWRLIFAWLLFECAEATTAAAKERELDPGEMQR